MSLEYQVYGQEKADVLRHPHEVIDYAQCVHGSNEARWCWWIGWIEEVPGVNCQGRSQKELLATLQASLSEALEFNRQNAIHAAESGYTEELVTA